MTPLARRMALLPMLAVGILALLSGLVVSGAAANAGPTVAKCGKLKNKAKKQQCLKQNKANRIAFNQVKNSKFVGERGDGQSLDHTFCANGKYETRSSSSTGTGVSTGKRWRIVDATVRRGGKWIDAFVKGQGGFEIAVQRRGATWKIGIASLGRILYPGEMEKTNAAADCARLQV